jgi:hypothetical protein
MLTAEKNCPPPLKDTKQERTKAGDGLHGLNFGNLQTQRLQNIRFNPKVGGIICFPRKEMYIYKPLPDL